ncbi:polysaccharide pyruvyl transferase family protein [Sphingomonas profundi]|uniref:polysaccharide pyruvyl transferase family protein n=1 Tax=Alterirhizorhabdus profundi TaxID=2681549 RepID=UPI0012E77401|nr:polysaccharide pyruvyl transferase family protein [Sphingomonas profundi]
MTIEVKGINFSNQGAGMMLLAVQQRLGSRFDLAVPAQGDYALRAPFGMKQILRRAGPLNLAPFVRATPARIRQRIGLVAEREIGGVLDASGFAYGDQWGAAKVRERLFAALDRRRRSRSPVILLPQALGPFTKPDLRQAFGRVVDEASLIFVRDEVSAGYLAETYGERPNIRRCPDFTIGLSGLADPRYAAYAGRPALVPNHMVVRDATPAERDRYVDLLAAGAREAGAQGFGDPFLALHDPVQDAAIADALAERLGRVERLGELRPQVMKAILGHASLVIGSRFHALVGALSHGTPVVAFGWSHKYAELLGDFGCPEALVANDADPATVIALVRRIAAEREARAAALSARAAALAAQVESMWSAVATELETAR